MKKRYIYLLNFGGGLVLFSLGSIELETEKLLIIQLELGICVY
jgi:hypothetical protein